MGVSLDIYRASIGNFALCIKSKNCISLNDYIALNYLCFKCNPKLLLHVLTILLIIGNVEKNPGPPKISLEEIHKLLLSNSSQLNENSAKLNALPIIQNSIENLNATVVNLSGDVKTVTKDLSETKSDVRELQKQNLDLKKTIHNLDRRSRKNNVIFYGFENIGAESQSDQENKICEFCKDYLKVNINSSDIENCYRLGKNFNKPRPVFVKFCNYKLKSELFKNAKNLKNTNYAISDDLTPSERQDRYKLMKHKATANKMNLRARVSRNNLIVEDISYSLNELDDPNLFITIKNSLEIIDSDHEDDSSREKSNKRGRESTTPPESHKKLNSGKNDHDSVPSTSQQEN